MLIVYLGDTGIEQRHLLGAYSFAVAESIDFATYGLLQAGAWNYLREEITVALECRRSVRTGRIFESHPVDIFADDMQANHISYLLAQIINFSFPDISERTSQEERTLAWQNLKSDLIGWKARLPTRFDPFCTAPMAGNVFPSLWMLRPWHGKPLSTFRYIKLLTRFIAVASQQYFAIAEMLLTLFNPSPVCGHLGKADLEFAEDRALRVCGLAKTNDDVSAKVNAFGPLAFCKYFSVAWRVTARFLTRK